MKVSKKAYYGLRAVVALAQTEDGRSVHELSKAEQLPEDYLEKILQTLKRRGFVVSTKGAHGGYMLARPATTLTSWHIIETLDGGFQTLERGVFDGTLAPCPVKTHCQTKSVWEQLEGSIRHTLSNVTIADLIPKGNSVTK